MYGRILRANTLVKRRSWLRISRILILLWQALKKSPCSLKSPWFKSTNLITTFVWSVGRGTLTLKLPMRPIPNWSWQTMLRRMVRSTLVRIQTSTLPRKRYTSCKRCTHSGVVMVIKGALACTLTWDNAWVPAIVRSHLQSIWTKLKRSNTSWMAIQKKWRRSWMRRWTQLRRIWNSNGRLIYAISWSLSKRRLRNKRLFPRTVHHETCLISIWIRGGCLFRSSSYVKRDWWNVRSGRLQLWSQLKKKWPVLFCSSIIGKMRCCQKKSWCRPGLIKQWFRMCCTCQYGRRNVAKNVIY